MLSKLPNEVVEIRSEICSSCQTKCEMADDLEFKINPCSSCHIHKWGVYGRCKNFGLGDAVAAVAQPIAKAIDAVAGTNVQGCGACKKRQEALNKLIPSL